MSFAMTNSIAFAKWVFTKLRENDTFNDNHDIDFIINQIDENYWQLFISTNQHYNAAKDAVDNIIPALVQKMPKTTRNNNNNKTKGKGKVFRADAQTSTNDDADIQPMIIHYDSNYLVSNTKSDTDILCDYAKNTENMQILNTLNYDDAPHAATDAGQTEEKKKKRQYKKKLTLEPVPVLDAADTLQPDKMKKKRQYKKKPDSDVVQDAEQLVQDGTVTVQPEKIKKKRQYKKKPDSDVEDAEQLVQDGTVTVQPEKKKRQYKKKLDSDVVQDGAEDTEQLVQDGAVTVQDAEQPVQDGAISVQPEKKKRQYKKKPDSDVVQDADDGNEKKMKKRQNEQKKNNTFMLDNNDIDVVVPNKEFTMLNDLSLQEEPFEHSDSEQITLTEIFIDDVLFYQDEHGQRFDILLNPLYE